MRSWCTAASRCGHVRAARGGSGCGRAARAGAAGHAIRRSDPACRACSMQRCSSSMRRRQGRSVGAWQQRGRWRARAQARPGRPRPQRQFRQGPRWARGARQGQQQTASSHSGTGCRGSSSSDTTPACAALCACSSEPGGACCSTNAGAEPSSSGSSAPAGAGNSLTCTAGSSRSASTAAAWTSACRDGTGPGSCQPLRGRCRDAGAGETLPVSALAPGSSPWRGRWHWHCVPASCACRRSPGPAVGRLRATAQCACAQ
jgi:hypothetical protein